MNLFVCNSEQKFYLLFLFKNADTPVTLQAGSNENIGYVYVNYEDSSRTICGDDFSEKEADVICRNIGSETFQWVVLSHGLKEMF